MLEYKCDWCGRQKKPDDAWILGLAVEHKGVTGSRRQFETLRRWTTKWASHPLAVHLCCEQHKRNYLDALFTSPWPAANKGSLARAAHLRRSNDGGRTRKDDSGALAEWYIKDEHPFSGQDQDAQEKKTAPKKEQRKIKKAQPPAIIFSATDHLHARALGIMLDPADSAEKPQSKPPARR